MTPRHVLTGLAATLALTGAGGGWARVRAHEARERDLAREGTFRQLARAHGSTAQSAHLLELDLEEGDLAVFELCTTDGLPSAWEGALRLVVWETDDQRLLVRRDLDDAGLADARRSERGACITVGNGEVPWTGPYAFDAVYGDTDAMRAIADVPVRATALVRWPLGALDAVFVLLAWLGAAVWVGLVFAGRPHASAAGAIGPMPPPDPVPRATKLGGAARILAGSAAALAVAIGLNAWTRLAGDVGAAGVLVQNMVLAAAEVVIAFAFVSGTGGRSAALGLTRPRVSIGQGLVAFAVTAMLMSVVAHLATRFVPSTGTAPIETFVREPSGTLSFATLAVLAPIAEELFFRGFVYGTALRFGRVVAFALAALLFAGAHAPQAWGGWGALSAVVAAGVGLTALRAWSGSIAVPVAAHLLYNAALAYGGFR